MKSVECNPSRSTPLFTSPFPQAPTLIIAVLLLISSGCKTVHTPLPVYGSGEDISQLLGEWYGEYTSQEANRHGVIYFKLDVSADSAVGHVIMKQGQWDDQYYEDITAPHNQPSELLTIRFVQVGLDRVMGRLDEYKDPICGCPLHTVFEGHVEDDRIEGVYVTHGDEFHMTTSGQWSVNRYKKPPVSVSK